MAADADGRWSEPAGLGLRWITVTAPGFARADVIVAGDQPGEIRLAAATARSIAGRLLLPDGSAAPGWSVRARACDEPWGIHEVRAETGTDGRFVLDDVGATPVILEADLFVSGPSSSLVDPSATTTGPVEPGSTGVEMRIAGRGSIAGRVVDERGMGVPQASVCLVFRRPSDRVSTLLACSAQDGAFRFAGLADGLYVIASTVDRRNGWCATAVGDLRPGAEDLRIVLGTGRPVRGTVRRPSGLPVAGGTVRVVPRGATATVDLSRSWLPRACVRDDGGFDMPEVPPGPWEFRFEEPTDGGPATGGATPSELRLMGADGVTATAVGLQLQVDEGAVVRGRVSVPGGAPTGMTAAVRSCRTDRTIERPLAADAGFLFRGLDPDDAYDLTIRHAGSTWFDRRGVSPDGAPIDVRIEAPAQVRGRVVSRDGVPLAGSLVRFIVCDAAGHPIEPVRWHPGCTTDADGRFVAEWLPPVDVRAWIVLQEDAPGRPATIAVGLERDGSASTPLELRLKR